MLRVRLVLAAAAAALALGPPGRAAAGVVATNAFEVTATTAVPIETPYFLYSATGPGMPSFPLYTEFLWAQPLAPIPVTGGHQTFTHDVPVNPGSYLQESALIGTYLNVTGAPGVVILLSDAAAADVLKNNTPWISLFPNFPEDRMVTTLRDGAPGPALFLLSSRTDIFPTWQPDGAGGFTLSGTLVGFSDPVRFGSAGATQGPPGTAAAVPEPLSLALAGVGVLGLAGWARRRTVAV